LTGPGESLIDTLLKIISKIATAKNSNAHETKMKFIIFILGDALKKLAGHTKKFHAIFQLEKHTKI
jgi:hypothetical protein